MIIQIYGEPKPQKRPRASRRGKHIHMYSEKSEWRKHCTEQLSRFSITFDKPLFVGLVFYMPRPKSHYRTGKFSHLLKDSAPKYHVTKPDCDNLSKAVLDAMTDAGIITDDSIIVKHDIYKKYATDKAGVKIEIEEL